jgi:hypothetical protein
VKEERMATGHTQAELNALLQLMEELVPPIPRDQQKRAAKRVTAMRAAGTEMGMLVNIETKTGAPELFWLNCWVAKELAAPSILHPKTMPGQTAASRQRQAIIQTHQKSSICRALHRCFPLQRMPCSQGYLCGSS